MRPFIACLPLLLLAPVLGGCDKPKPAEPQAAAPGPAETAALPPGRLDRSHKGEAAPAVPFTAPDGTPATLATWRGKPLLVNLWATWCGPCVREMPALDALAAAEAGRMQVMVVSQDMAGKKEVDPFFAKAGFTTLKPYLDKQNVLMEALKTDVLPTTVLFDRHGREVWRVVGARDWTGAEAKALLAEAA